jgi:hypothetical protein
MGWVDVAPAGTGVTARPARRRVPYGVVQLLGDRVVLLLK